MKHLLLTTFAAVLVVGCGESQSPKPPTAKAPVISIHKAAYGGNIEAVKQHLAAGADVNEKATLGRGTSLHTAAAWWQSSLQFGRLRSPRKEDGRRGGSLLQR